MASNQNLGSQPQEYSKTNDDIFDYDRVPKGPAAARAQRVAQSRQQTQATTTNHPNMTPDPGHAARMAGAGTPFPNYMGYMPQQPIDGTPFRPHEDALGTALAQMQVRIRESSYNSIPRGAKDWDRDVAKMKQLVMSAYGQQAIGWCEIAQQTIEEERQAQANVIRQRDDEISRLRRDVERVSRDYAVLKTTAGEGIGEIWKKAAEIKEFIQLS